MSYKVPLTTIKEIKPHPNAERLEIAVVYAWEIIVKKDYYKVGDVVVLIPLDSIIPQWLEDKLFTPDSKIKLTKHRVRQIKIRNYPSQGMLVDPKDVADGIAAWAEANGKKKVDLELEQDLAEMIGVTKYEPEVHDNTPRPATPRNKPKENPLLHKYNGLENIKWYPDLFKEGEEVVIQEKLHGTNARYALLPTQVNTFWKKVKKFFGLLEPVEFCYGSNNVQLQDKTYTGYYEDNIYNKVGIEEEIQYKLESGETVYGEIIGPGIQAGYSYGVPQGQYRFILFDVKKYDGTQSYYLTPDEVERFANERGFEMVPVLYKGPYSYAKAKELSMGPSVYHPAEKVREGCVIKASSNINESASTGNKRMLKLISEEYLSDAKNTDNH